jgi:ribosomal protein L37AE/L43A
MISQRCPKCHSSRIRRGYRPTPIWSKMIFRYNLLCDGCNWEFTGFAVPGTVEKKTNRKTKKRKKGEEINNDFDADSAVEQVVVNSKSNR